MQLLIDKESIIETIELFLAEYRKETSKKHTTIQKKADNTNQTANLIFDYIYENIICLENEKE